MDYHTARRQEWLGVTGKNSWIGRMDAWLEMWAPRILAIVLVGIVLMALLNLDAIVYVFRNPG